MTWLATCVGPWEWDANEHKRQQLKELALLNGTLRDEDQFESRERMDEDNKQLYSVRRCMLTL
jgi:hypothetical protein